MSRPLGLRQREGEAMPPLLVCVCDDRANLAFFGFPGTAAEGLRPIVRHRSATRYWWSHSPAITAFCEH